MVSNDELPLECQGSILGPTLFLIYINDLCQLHLGNGQIFTFADDTALFFSGDSWDGVFGVAQEGFNRVVAWLRNNVLTLNVAKTKYVAFAHRSNVLPPRSLSITAHTCWLTHQPCVCPSLQRTNNIKYLGVTLDQFLSFKPHIDVLVTRLRKLIYIFKSLKHVADRRTIKMVYYALCQSLIDYCIISWGGAAKTHLMEAERAQRAILKVAAGLPYRFSTVDLYKKWDVLSIRQTFVLHTVLKKHSQLIYDSDLLKDKRRKGTVCNTKFFRLRQSHKFFCYLGDYLYNVINKGQNIYPLHKTSCKKKVTDFLKTLSYEETEKLLHPIA